MKTLTFAFDCQLNDNEDWIKEGTVVQISDNEHFLSKYEGYTPVIVTEGYTFEGEHFTMKPDVVWFSNGSFKELQ